MDLPGFFIAVVLLELTPGPNMAYLATLSLSDGRRAGLLAALGVAFGLAVHAVLGAFGAGEIVERSPFLYEALRWIGVAYLLWLAYEGWRGEGETSPGRAGHDGVRSGRDLMLRGFLSNVFNPKSILFFVTIVPIFAGGAEPGLFWRMATLGAVYVAVATAVHVGIVLAAAQARPYIVEGAKRDMIRRALSLLLAGVAIWLAFNTAR